MCLLLDFIAVYVMLFVVGCVFVVWLFCYLFVFCFVCFCFCFMHWYLCFLNVIIVVELTRSLNGLLLLEIG